MKLRVAFLNCQNHFTIQARSSRGPADAIAYASKVEGLATVLLDCFTPELPDVFGLCELGSMTAARDILSAVGQRNYDLVWQTPPPRRRKGLEPRTAMAICFDRDLLEVEQVLKSEMTVQANRYHWYAAQMRIRPTNQVFWFVVNHWPSDLSQGQVRGTWPRALLAAAVGEFAASELRKGVGRILLMGDFNCEPFDVAMTGSATAWKDRMIGARERDRVSNVGNTLPHFYNLMWRHVGEENPYDMRQANDRPPGTFRMGDEWRCLDQILVDRSLMTGPGIVLRESSVRIVRPRLGGTDHCAIGATLDYT